MKDNTKSGEALDRLTAWLQQRHDDVMSAEKQALASLKAGENDGYRQLMRHKAELLADMEQDVADLVSQLPTPLASSVGGRIGQFSRSAAMALNLDSVFYMSALLYRDDHKEGEPDNLALFITEIKNSRG